MKYITTLFILFCGQIVSAHLTEVDSRTLTEKVYTGNIPWTIFSCKVIMEIKSKDSVKTVKAQPNRNAHTFDQYTPQPTVLTKVEIISVYFGKIDSSFVLLRTEGHNPKLEVDKTYLIFCPTGKGWKVLDGSRQINGIADSTSEILLLKQFEDVFKNKKTGAFTFKNSKGIVMAEGSYKKGKAVGVWKHYYNNGIIKTESDPENNITKAYYTNGFIAEKSTMTKLQQSTERYSSSVNGLINYKRTLTTTDTGSVMVDFKYYNSGKLKSTLSMTNGNQNKMYFVEYYENGKERKEGNVFYTRKTGVWKKYNESGELTEFDYGKGDLHVTYFDDK